MFLDRRQFKPTPALAACVLLCLAGTARSQTSADLTLVGEYAVRGVALSNGPVAQLRVDHDTDAGWYAGAFLSPMSMNHQRDVQGILYAGRAGRLGPDLGWDAGIVRTVYARDTASNYHEFQAGLLLRRASARIYYSPAYYGRAPGVYLDLSGAHGLGDHLSVVAHAGVLHSFGEAGAAYGAGGSAAYNRVDGRLGLAWDVGDVSLQAGWQHVWRLGAGVRRAHALTASVSRHF